MSAQWWWLSFCDASRPVGEQFLGVSIVGPAQSMGHASMLAWARGCNPGGEIVGGPVRPGGIEQLPEADRNRLLTRDEARAADRKMMGPPS
jgi:hypothetical protein